MSLEQKYLIVIAGATAVGKTDTAIQIAKHFQTEIISADSRQCYREMNIGTAKPTENELAEVKHYFIDSHSFTENISAADYESLALEYLDNIFQKNNMAVLCGGTGLYIKAAIEGLDEMPEINETINQQVNQEFQENGLAWLQDEIAKVDPEFYKLSEQQNPHRLIRALVFKKSTGKSILSFKTGIKKQRDFKTIMIGLELERTQLYERINHRVDKMVEDGLIKEAKELFPFRNLKNLQTVGYQEFYENETFYNNKEDVDFAIEKIKQHTRNYAKRQMTYFKRQLNLNWFAPNEVEKMIAFIENEIS